MPAGQHTNDSQRRAGGKTVGASSYAAAGPNPARRSPGIFAKTRPCQFFANNCCLRGDSCNFAHGDVDLRPTPDFRQTQFCIEFSRFGHCDNGESCTFAHSVEELRAVSRPLKGNGYSSLPQPSITSRPSPQQKWHELRGPVPPTVVSQSPGSLQQRQQQQQQQQRASPAAAAPAAAAAVTGRKEQQAKPQKQQRQQQQQLQPQKQEPHRQEREEQQVQEVQHKEMSHNPYPQVSITVVSPEEAALMAAATRRPSIATASQSNPGEASRSSPSATVSVEHKVSDGSSFMTMTDAESPVSSQPSTTSSYSGVGRSNFNFHDADPESAESRMSSSIATLRVGKRRSSNLRLPGRKGLSFSARPALSEEDEEPMTKHSKTEGVVQVSISKTFFHFISEEEHALGSSSVRRNRSCPPRMLRASV